MPETSEQNTVQRVREGLDDAIDVVEDKIEEIRNPVARALAGTAIAMLRGVLALPDDVGGDED